MNLFYIKTLLSALLNMLPGIKISQFALQLKSVTIDLSGVKWVSKLFTLKFYTSDLWYYLPGLLKQVVKESLGFEIEPEVLFILLGGYLLLAKRSIFNNRLVQKLRHFKTFHFQQLKMA